MLMPDHITDDYVEFEPEDEEAPASTENDRYDGYEDPEGDD